MIEVVSCISNKNSDKLNEIKEVTRSGANFKVSVPKITSLTSECVKAPLWRVCAFSSYDLHMSTSVLYN